MKSTIKNLFGKSSPSKEKASGHDPHSLTITIQPSVNFKKRPNKDERWQAFLFLQALGFISFLSLHNVIKVANQGKTIQEQGEKIAKLEERGASNDHTVIRIGPVSHEPENYCSNLVESLEIKMAEKINSVIKDLNNGKLLIKK